MVTCLTSWWRGPASLSLHYTAALSGQQSGTGARSHPPPKPSPRGAAHASRPRTLVLGGARRRVSRHCRPAPHSFSTLPAGCSAHRSPVFLDSQQDREGRPDRWVLLAPAGTPHCQDIAVVTTLEEEPFREQEDIENP